MSDRASGQNSPIFYGVMMFADVSFLTLFILGFFGGTHCVGMCGGLSSAFALQLPPHIPRIVLIVLMNVGRLCSYVLIGVFAAQLQGILQNRAVRLVAGLLVCAWAIWALVRFFQAA